MESISYKRSVHAAHYAYDHRGRGHDLESWDCILPSYNAPKPEGIPAKAERTSGYIDRAGQQHVVFTAIAPITEGTCKYCCKRGEEPTL